MCGATQEKLCIFSVSYAELGGLFCLVSARVYPAMMSLVRSGQAKQQTFSLHTPEHSSTPDRQGARKLRKIKQTVSRPSRKPVLTENRNNICSKNLERPEREVVGRFTHCYSVMGSIKHAASCDAQVRVWVRDLSLL
jgi:hypothetical protein